MRAVEPVFDDGGGLPRGRLPVERVPVERTPGMTITGRLMTDDGGLLAGWTVSAVDRQSGTVTFPPVTTGLNGDFALEAALTPARGAGPRVTFYVAEGARVVKVLEPELTWSAGAATIDIVVAAPPPPVYYVYGWLGDPAMGAGVGGATVTATDAAGGRDAREAATGPTGLFELWWPADTGAAPVVRLGVTADGADVACDAHIAPFDDAHVAAAVVELAWGLSGTVVDADTQSGLGGAHLEAWDPSGALIAAGDADAAGVFSLTIARRPGAAAPAAADLRVYRQGVLATTARVDLAWEAGGRATVRVAIPQTSGGHPELYRLTGMAIDRATRAGVAGLRVEAWATDGRAMLAAADTTDGGRFAVGLAAGPDGHAPQPQLRFYRAGRLLAQIDAPVVSTAPQASVFAEVDLPPDGPPAFRIAGRVIDTETRAGIDGLRLEAWQKGPRDGGALGVAAVTAADGAFEVTLPREPTATADPDEPGRTPPIIARPPRDVPTTAAGGATRALTHPVGVSDLALGRPPVDAVPVAAAPPEVFFRLYAEDRLLPVPDADVTWGAGALGTTVIATTAPAPVSHEVSLHELGDSIASTVGRVQAELARYPATMGAYVLDEIDLDVPVEMRVDALGQVRTKVVDAATPDRSVGQVRMKVRPVLGATASPGELRDQPLEVLDVSAAVVGRLQELRIYSVEDLARAASSGAARAALAELELGLDVDGLLAKAALLAFAGIDRRIREALVDVGVDDLAAFAGAADPPVLATKLSARLGQTFTADDVAAWQATVRRALAIPRPTRAAEPDADEPEGALA